MEEDLDILRSDWMAFIGRWLPVIAPSEWALFAIQTEAMVDRLADQVKLETSLLYDHAVRSGGASANWQSGGFALH